MQNSSFDMLSYCCDVSLLFMCIAAKPIHSNQSEWNTRYNRMRKRMWKNIYICCCWLSMRLDVLPQFIYTLLHCSTLLSDRLKFTSIECHIPCVQAMIDLVLYHGHGQFFFSMKARMLSYIFKYWVDMVTVTVYMTRIFMVKVKLKSKVFVGHDFQNEEK